MGLGKMKRMGANIHPGNAARGEANTATLTSSSFKKACTKAGTEPTTRQAGKWNMKKGTAWRNR